MEKNSELVKPEKERKTYSNKNKGEMNISDTHSNEHLQIQRNFSLSLLILIIFYLNFLFVKRSATSKATNIIILTKKTHEKNSKIKTRICISFLQLERLKHDAINMQACKNFCKTIFFSFVMICVRATRLRSSLKSFDGSNNNNRTNCCWEKCAI